MQRLFIRQLEIYGSTGGSIEEFRQLLELFARGGIKPVIDHRLPLEAMQHALDRLGRGGQLGKILVTVP